MRVALLFTTLFSFAIVGCSSDEPGTGSGGGGDADMAMAATMDMTMEAKPDMTKPAPTSLGCGGVLMCLQGGNSATCFMKATPKAQMLLGNLINCGKMACLDMGDAGTGSCTDVSDQSQECLQCAAGDIQGGDCGAELQACLADT